MIKIRTFFGLGRKPIGKSKQRTGEELPENFIVGSTNQQNVFKIIPAASDDTDSSQKK